LDDKNVDERNAKETERQVARDGLIAIVQVQRSKVDKTRMLVDCAVHILSTVLSGDQRFCYNNFTAARQR